VWPRLADWICGPCFNFNFHPLGSVDRDIYRFIYTVHRCCARLTYTGFLCGSASCSKLRLSSTGPCPATPRVTCQYLADDCQLVADARVRQLRSADTRTLVVSRTRSSFGDRTFATAGPQVRNSLPPNLRLCWLS